MKGGEKNSFKTRYVRQPKRSNIGKQLQNNGNPSKLWHEELNALSNDNFEIGYLKGMGNNKNVYKTIKYEEVTSQLPEQNLL